MSLRGYKPKHAKAPWTLAAQAVNERGTITKVKFISSRSKTASRLSRPYPPAARAFVAAAIARGETCPVVANVPEMRGGRKYGHPVSARLNEVHHVFGRGHGGRGPLLMDQRLWMAISKQGHRWIDAHKAEARARGWLAPLGWYDRPVPADAKIDRNEWGGLRVTLADGSVLGA